MRVELAEFLLVAGFEVLGIFADLSSPDNLHTVLAPQNHVRLAVLAPFVVVDIDVGNLFEQRGLRRHLGIHAIQQDGQGNRRREVSLVEPLSREWNDVQRDIFNLDDRQVRHRDVLHHDEVLVDVDLRVGLADLDHDDRLAPPGADLYRVVRHADSNIIEPGHGRQVAGYRRSCIFRQREAGSARRLSHAIRRVPVRPLRYTDKNQAAFLDRSRGLDITLCVSQERAGTYEKTKDCGHLHDGDPIPIPNRGKPLLAGSPILPPGVDPLLQTGSLCLPGHVHPLVFTICDC